MMELENCPLCDGPAVNKAFPGKVVQGWLGCPKCGLRIQWKISPDGAIRKWNRRVWRDEGIAPYAGRTEASA